MALTKLRYHIVTGTKNSKNLIDDTIRERLYEILHKTADELNGHLLNIGGTEDHVHLLAAIRPGVPIGNFVSQLKAKSSGVISEEFPEYSEFAWADGYGAFTIWPSDVQKVGRYIENQKWHHHGEGRVKEVLERTDEAA
jgi:REP element-mobilizing transposase RayT